MVLKFTYLKDLDGVYPFNISRVDGGKEHVHGKGVVEVTVPNTYKTTLVLK